MSWNLQDCHKTLNYTLFHNCKNFKMKKKFILWNCGETIKRNESIKWKGLKWASTMVESNFVHYTIKFCKKKGEVFVSWGEINYRKFSSQLNENVSMAKFLILFLLSVMFRNYFKCNLVYHEATEHQTTTIKAWNSNENCRECVRALSCLVLWMYLKSSFYKIKISYELLTFLKIKNIN